MFKSIYPRKFSRMATIEVFAYNLKYVKYGKLPTVACKNVFSTMRLARRLLTQLTTCLFQLTFHLLVRRCRVLNLLISRLLSRHM